MHIPGMHLDTVLTPRRSSEALRQQQEQQQALQPSRQQQQRQASQASQANQANQRGTRPDSVFEEGTDTSETSFNDNLALRPSPAELSRGIALYFEHCHRQPVFLFEPEDVSDYGSLQDELACSILALTLCFSENREQAPLYGNIAKSLIMLRIANGTVDLPTLESLCLLSYSGFNDGNVHLGQFYLGMALQLCRSAMLDIELVYADDPLAERKKRLFWSLQMLEQYYGRQEGLLSVPAPPWRPLYSTSRGHHVDAPHPRAPSLPRDSLGCTRMDEPGIWNTTIHLGSIWNRVRQYVSECARNRALEEPWRHDSTYAKVVADFLETENRIPLCHRYDTVKFYERKVEELRTHRDYWKPWVKEQFTYHVIPMVLNHPFLYIVGAQHNPNLAIPNTFWRRSSELALLHSTWIVRMIDMVVDKQLPLTDPFFGHVAAIAATVHLYYCCAANVRLKHKSNTDFAKCRRFLKSFIPTSAACRHLDRNLNKMTRIAAGSESTDIEDWMPSKIYLSVPLMWKILQFNAVVDSQEMPAHGILDPASLMPRLGAAAGSAHQDRGHDHDNNNNNDDDDEASENLTLEIVVATSPEITINTADGGQEAPTASYRDPSRASGSTGPAGPAGPAGHTGHSDPSSAHDTVVSDEVLVEDSLTLCTTPWLYADSSQFVNMGDMGYGGSHAAVSEARGNAWWEGEQFSNIMFNHF